MTQTSMWQGEPAHSRSSRPASQPRSPQHPANGTRAVPGITIGGRYQLRAAIGHGGMGTVWQAVDTLLRRDVAVKELLLPPGMASTDRDAMFERTLREARAAAALSHPSVVQVYDVVVEDERPWIVMELLHARSLAEMIISDGPLATRAVAKIGVALLGALEVAHGAGVLHRDVKPANVLICTDGRCVLTDFGVARMRTESNLTTPGMVLGSPHFISPERAVGGAFGPPSDLFSLGVTLYTAVEGRPPFDRGDPFDTMRAVVEEPPMTPTRAGVLTPILYGLLEKDPDRRWDVVRARHALRELLVGQLANKAAQHVTDPYAVIPPAPAPAPPQYAPEPSGTIGGRAMLAPGEMPVDRMAPRHSNNPTVKAVLEDTNPGRPGVHPGFGPAHGAAHAHGGIVSDIRAGAAHAGRSLLHRYRMLPQKARWAVVGGAAALVLVVLIGGLSGWFGGGGPSGSAGAHATATPSNAKHPLIDSTPYQDSRGFTVNVPTGWVKSGKSPNYVDFTDPKDRGRFLRLNVEPAGSSARSFLNVAEGILSRDNRKCADPYDRIGLTDVRLADRAAAELEYTCGDGENKRHGIWRATVVNGKAYEFYLSTEDSRFAESEAIYDELVQSYALNLSS